MITAEVSPYAHVLARAAARIRWRDLPAEVRSHAEDLALDTLAVIAAGAAHPSFRPFRDGRPAESGPCTVIGGAGGAGEMTAALLNAGATTVLQHQDGHRMARGHPASHILPTVLALAQSERRTLEAVMAALVAGYEVGTRCGMALGGLHPLLHDAGTWACLGAAAGGAHLLSGGEAAVIAEALEGAAAVASMGYRETCAAGATVHHLYIGLGAVTALTAARAAQAGLQSLEGALERYFGPRVGAAFEPRRLLDRIGPDGGFAHFELLRGYIKVHPLCAHLHGAVDAMAELVAEAPIDPGAVESIEVATYAHALDYAAGRPVNDLAARFSLKAAMAVALGAEGMTSAAIGAAPDDPSVIALIDRVTVAHDPALDVHYPRGRPARVTVVLKDGAVRSRTVIDALGDAHRPTDRAQRRAKAKPLLDGALGPGRFEALAAVLDDVTADSALGRLGELLKA